MDKLKRYYADNIGGEVCFSLDVEKLEQELKDQRVVAADAMSYHSKEVEENANLKQENATLKARVATLEGKLAEYKARSYIIKAPHRA